MDVLFYQRLSSRTADIILSLILQNILHGIRLVIIPNNSTWERHLSCFNGIIAMINSYDYRNHILSFFLFNVRSKMLSLLQRIVAKVPFVNTFLCSSVPKPAENLAFLYHYRQRNTTVPSQPVIKIPLPAAVQPVRGRDISQVSFLNNCLSFYFYEMFFLLL